MPGKSVDYLVPFSQGDEEDHKEAARKGGIKSGESRREKRKLKDLLEIALSLTNSEGVDNYMSMTIALINKAMDGDTKAYEVIRDTLGQRPKEEVELSTSNSIEINITNDKLDSEGGDSEL